MDRNEVKKKIIERMETELGLLTRVRDLQYLIDFADLIYVECNVTKEEGDEAGDFSDQRETEIATTNMGTMIAQLHFTCEYLLKDIFEAVRAMFPDQASQEAYLVKLAEGEDLQLIQTVISNRNMHLANFAYCQQMLNPEILADFTKHEIDNAIKGVLIINQNQSLLEMEWTFVMMREFGRFAKDPKLSDWQRETLAYCIAANVPTMSQMKSEKYLKKMKETTKNHTRDMFSYSQWLKELEFKYPEKFKLY